MSLTELITPLLEKYDFSRGQWNRNREEVISRIPEMYMPNFERLERKRRLAGKKSTEYFRIMHTIRKIEVMPSDNVYFITPENHMFPDTSSVTTAKKGESLHLRRIKSVYDLSDDTTPEKLFRERANIGQIVRPIVSYDWQGISKGCESINVVTPTDLRKAYKKVANHEVEVRHDYTKAPQAADIGGVIVGDMKSDTNPDFKYHITISRVPMTGKEPQSLNWLDISSETHGECAKKAFQQLHYGRTGRPSERRIKGRQTPESFMCFHIIANYLAHLKMSRKYAISQNPFLIMRKKAIDFYDKLDRVVKIVEEKEADGKIRTRARLLTDVDKNIIMMKYLMMRPDSYTFSYR
ncbi:hypothetical protein KY345_03710 [Candidatus Woesearchaeota archaeon]|nr:hypothetical protein [Candidatus Woesearchaeota archaeon]